MPRFDKDSAVSALEIQQLINEWSNELDIHGGANVAGLCTPDCDYYVGGNLFKGSDPINAFYAARNVRVAEQQKDGIRTQRHSISNIRVYFTDADHAKGEFTLVNYSHEGKPPVPLNGPTIVADVRMEFARGSDQEWRISLFDSVPLFIGNDPFLNANVVKK